jgi:hypothetical protein
MRWLGSDGLKQLYVELTGIKIVYEFVTGDDWVMV